MAFLIKSLFLSRMPKCSFICKDDICGKICKSSSLVVGSYTTSNLSFWVNSCNVTTIYGRADIMAQRNRSAVEIHTSHMSLEFCLKIMNLPHNLVFNFFREGRLFVLNNLLLDLGFHVFFCCFFPAFLSVCLSTIFLPLFMNSLSFFLIPSC